MSVLWLETQDTTSIYVKDEQLVTDFTERRKSWRALRDNDQRNLLHEDQQIRLNGRNSDTMVLIAVATYIGTHRPFPIIWTQLEF